MKRLSAVLAAVLACLGIAVVALAATDSSPSNTSTPTLSGTTVVGQTLTGPAGSWAGAAPVNFAYQWQSCTTATTGCTDIPGAITSSYALDASDVGKWIAVNITAANRSGTKMVQSNIIGPVTDGTTTTTTSTSTTSTSSTTTTSTSSTTSTTPTSTTTSTTTPPTTLTDDPSYVGPSFYAKFSNGPSSSMSYFPSSTYQVNLNQWSQLPSRIKQANVNSVDQAYDGGGQMNLNTAAANGLRENVEAALSSFNANQAAIMSFAMQDEPNSSTSAYAASNCPPSNDTCAGKYVTDANKYRTADPTRPVWGNFSKDVTEWSYPPPGWSDAQFTQHMKTMIGALNIASADVYGWTDPWEWSQSNPAGGTGHFGAWVYGHAIDRIRYYNPNIPAYGFVECCDSGDGSSSKNPTNTMMPGMITSAVWNILVHGGRGWIWWTTDFGSPGDKPFPGATYYGNYAPYGDQKWSGQYNAMSAAGATVKADAVQLNSPTVTGVSVAGTGGVPVAALGKDVAGKLWLLAQADGNASHPLSNTSSMTATITTPLAAGTVLQVVGESRSVTVGAGGTFTDTFATTTETPTYGSKPLTYGYQKHIYQEN